MIAIYIYISKIFEPRHVKTNIMILLYTIKWVYIVSVRPVWSESLLCTQRVAKDPRFLRADSKDCDQIGRMPSRWAHTHFIIYNNINIVFDFSRLIFLVTNSYHWLSAHFLAQRVIIWELLWSYLPLSGKKAHIWPCLIDSAFNFDRIFIKFADNRGSHKFSDEFEFWRDQTIHFGVTCPWEPKKPIVDLVRSIATSFLIGCSSNLQVTRTAINSFSGQIGLFSLELHVLALERCKIFP